MVPFKRPAADKSGIPVYQPGTTYQQLMQLQQPFVPVSCEYPTSSSSTSSSSYSTSVNNSTTSATHTATTLIPQPHTTITSSTANPNAINNNNNSTTTTNNNHIFVNQSNVNNNSSNIVATTTASNGIVAETNNNNNNNTTTANKEPNTSTSNSVSSLTSIAAQIHNHHINSSNANAVEDDLDHSKKTKDAITSPTNSSGNVSLGNSASSAMSFSSAVAPTSSVAYNSTLASMQQQQTHQQHPSLAYSYPQASQNHFLHANSLYANPAAIAKEVAQKNYQNALKLAAVSNALTGKPLSALTYSQVPFNKPALLPQPAYAAAPQLTSPRPGLAAPVSANRLPTATANSQMASQFLRGQTQFSALARAQNSQATYLTAAATNPYAQFMRPQSTNPATYNSALSMSQSNAYAAQAMQQAQAVAQMQAAANQQFMFYHNLQQQAQAAQYPGMTTSMATSGMNNAQQPGVHPNAALQQTAPPGTTTVVLNPYKKMKTS